MRGRAPILTRSRSAALSQDRTGSARERSAATRDRPPPSRDRSSSPKRAKTFTNTSFRMCVDPIVASQSVPTATIDLTTTPTQRLQEIPPPPPPAPGPPSLETIMAAVQAAVGSALTAAMVPYAAKLQALEKASKPPPAARRRAPEVPPTVAPNTQPEGSGNQVPPPTTQSYANTTAHRESDFIPVTRQNKKGKGKEKANTNWGATAQPTQTTPTPASYANAATSAANTQQPQFLRKSAKALPSITEVTVIRNGGFWEPQLEKSIRDRAADAIVREVRIKMAKIVAKPIPLRAGRWSIHPRSKGNFVFSFEGCIPFDLIKSYERLLLQPFHGSGQLCPSMGWTRFLVHGVPIWDDENEEIFNLEAILEEVRMMPGLKKATFAMEPRWLKRLDDAESSYSSITFALSDPDGKTTNTLLNGRAALFGKEVTVRKWIDKPALVQCSRCHALGHSKSSKACQLGKDSVKCYKCGGAHRSETHDQQCPRKHTIIGICDCQHFKCLNCHNRGHDCRDTRCPTRDLYRPRGGKGKARAVEPPSGHLQNATSGPSRLHVPPTAPQPMLTQVDFDRMEEYARAETERMEMDYEQFHDAVDAQATSPNGTGGHYSPLANPAAAASTLAPQQRNWSPSQPIEYNNPPTLD
jgi:hypothetical protein